VSDLCTGYFANVRADLFDPLGFIFRKPEAGSFGAHRTVMLEEIQGFDDPVEHRDDWHISILAEGLHFSILFAHQY